jgi:tryptophan synthase alpha chain
MSVERIDRCFEEARAAGRPVLVVYLCVGDPSLEDSLACARAALAAGADLLELGVPFSDPTADGPVIAAASHRAIRAGGSLRSALSLARTLRREGRAPLVLFSYYNPILAFGEADLPRAATEAGVDGLLVVDLPPEEGAPLRDAAERESLALVPLLAPTSGPQREATALARASGFVYYVSLTGVTGAAEAPLIEAGRRAAAIRERSGLPVVVGFGIDTPEKARAAAAEGPDGIVVGTAVVRAIAGAGDGAARRRAVAELVGAIRRALRADPTA